MSLLSLNDIKANFIELVSLADQNQPPHYLTANYSRTRVQNKTRLEGLLSAATRWIFEGVIMENNSVKAREDVFRKFEVSIFQHIERGIVELEAYHKYIDEVIEEGNTKEFDDRFLINFLKIFKPILKILKTPLAERLDELFKKIFTQPITAASLVQELEPFYNQQIFTQFELFSRQKIPWKELSDIVLRRNLEGGISPAVFSWLKNIMLVPEKDWVTPMAAKEWRDKVVIRLCKVLPAIWERIADSVDDFFGVGYDDFIILLTHCGFQDQLDPNQINIKNCLVDSESEIVKSDCLSRIPFEIDVSTKYVQFIPFRQMLRVDYYRRYAVYERVETTEKRSVEETLLVTEELVQSFLRHKLLVKSWKEESLSAGNFSFNLKGELRALTAHKTYPLDLKALDSFVWESAGNYKSYRASWLRIDLQCKLGLIFKSLKIGSLKDIAFKANKTSKLVRLFNINREFYISNIKPLKQQLRSDMTKYIAMLEEKDVIPPIRSADFILFWNHFVWDLFPGIQIPETYEKRLLDAYTLFLAQKKQIQLKQAPYLESNSPKAPIWKDLASIEI